MTNEFSLAHSRILQLIEDFEAHQQKYLLPSYQEAEVRKDFIDPFFEALGWDVGHRIQKNPWEQEVKVERAVNVALAQKKADYAFMCAPNYHDVRFYVEAKKPSIDLVRSVDAHFQTLRYGWSAGTPLAVLTDFEQIIVLDCRRKPHPESVLEQAHLRFEYRQFRNQETFAQFYWLFSREAHATGTFDRYVATLPKPRGGAKQRKLLGGDYQAVDESFLAELEEHRETLAKLYKKADQSLDSETLTEITQKTIDRLVFLRFLEDKLIEPDLRVADFGKRRDTWQDFVEASKRLDATYNGIVFKPHHHLDNPSLSVDPNDFGKVCERLSHLNSPYDFNAIPIHILGSIYERFLGKVIIATDKRVRVVEKPEVRKAGGVYYTPEYIVRYIVERTVGSLIDGKEPKDIWALQFADIACGSGSFLLGIYDHLLRYLERWYNESKLSPEDRLERDAKAKNHGCIRNDDGMWRLSLKLRRDILTKCVYGVDIDRQAVEVSQLSLFLKLLENESAGSARQFMMELGGGKSVRLLPDLSKNIVCGNSLVSWDVAGSLALDADEAHHLNPLDFRDAFPGVMRSGGFDAVIGNPPYEVVEKERGEASWPHDAFVRAVSGRSPEYAAAFGGKLNMFRFFLVRATHLIKSNGKFGMIMPMSILADMSCAKGREFLLSQYSDLEADCFPQKDNASKRIFKDAKLSTVIITGNRAVVATDSDKSIRVRMYPGNRFDELTRSARVYLSDAKLMDPKNIPIPLVSEEQLALCRSMHARASVIRMKDADWLAINRGEINQTTFKQFITLDESDARLLKGVEVARYKIRTKLSQGRREWLNEKRYLKAHGPRALTTVRRIATQRITGVDEKLRVVAALIDGPTYFADSTNSISISPKVPYALEYILGILNSTLAQWRFKLTSSNNNVGTNELESLPLRLISFADLEDKKRHTRMVELVLQLTATMQEAASSSDHHRELFIRKAASIDRQIDSLVYELFDLTPEEVALVEGGDH